jgi:CDP-diglyceride synthetase
MKNETPLKEQVKIVFALFFGIIAFALILAGFDSYIHHYQFPNWIRYTLNIVSILFAFSVGGCTFSGYLEHFKFKDKK